ncbi:MAG TPA: HypC/HybG/HupF family hydrogenase formation chaperone [Myxococcota bacterium]|nr:HypC/HybG/HupF family hydrogenase formation chaperone [Myxococcota bacterium]
MCLAVPGRVAAVFEEDGLRMARVDFGGVRVRVCLETLPEAEVGTWVLVHAGVALQRLDERAAAASLALLTEAAAAEEGP